MSTFVGTEYKIVSGVVKKDVASAGATTRFNAFGRREFSAYSTSNASAAEIAWWKKQPDYWTYCRLFGNNPYSSTYVSLGSTLDANGDG